MSSAMDLETRYCAHNDRRLRGDLTGGMLSARPAVAHGPVHTHQVRDPIAHLNIVFQALAETPMPATEEPHA